MNIDVVGAKTTECQEEIMNLVKTKYPNVYLAKLELWDTSGYQSHKTKLKYKEWLEWFKSGVASYIDWEKKKGKT